MEKIYIVTKFSDDEVNGSWAVILGVYDNEEDAKARVRDVYPEVKQRYIDNWRDRYSEDENLASGYFTFWINDAWDETKVCAQGFEVNKADWFLMER